MRRCVHHASIPKFIWHIDGLCINGCICGFSCKIIWLNVYQTNNDPKDHWWLLFQRQLSIIDFTLNCPPIRNNLTSASLLSMLIETDYLNDPPIRINLTSATHHTTGCFDDRLLTMMTDKGFYVP